MKKIVFLIFIMVIGILPITTYAKNNDDLILLSETTKYYKTVTLFPTDSLMKNSENSELSIEITEEEYNQASNIALYNITGNGSTETNYKKITTSIYQNGNYYRYKIDLSWKTMPSTRSYDIIAIGINPSVKIASSLHFNQYYCFTNGQCINNGTFYEKKSSTGAGASFKLPTGNLNSLSSTLYFDVSKNVDATIIQQDAYGDYSHATKTVSVSQAQNYNIGATGINLNSSIRNSYDSVSVTRAIWSGSW